MCGSVKMMFCPSRTGEMPSRPIVIGLSEGARLSKGLITPCWIGRPGQSAHHPPFKHMKRGFYSYCRGNLRGKRESWGSLPLPWGRQRDIEENQSRAAPCPGSAAMLASKWRRCDLRCISRDPGIPHGCDPRSFRLETERPLGTSADEILPTELQPLPAPARPA